MNGAFKEGETLYGELRQQIADRTAERDVLLIAIKDAVKKMDDDEYLPVRSILQAVLDTVYAAPVLRALYEGRLS